MAHSSDRYRLKRVQFVVSCLDDAPARRWDFVPGSREVAQRLGDYEARLVREPLQHRVIGMLEAEGRDVGAVEKRPLYALAGVAERPDAPAVGRRNGHLDRHLD